MLSDEVNKPVAASTHPARRVFMTSAFRGVDTFAQDDLCAGDLFGFPVQPGQVKADGR